MVNESTALALPIVKSCRCGASFDRPAWNSILWVGYQRPPGETVLELRTCSKCASTIALDVSTEPLRVGDLVLERLFPHLASSRRWGGQCERETWHARVEMRSTVTCWFAEVAIVDSANRRQVTVSADASTPELALDNAVEQLSVGREFLAAFRG